jgi:hypothetical protein
MNSEIVARLEDSLDNTPAIAVPSDAPASTPTLHAVGQQTSPEQQLLGLFRQLSADKQAALLALLRQ